MTTTYRLVLQVPLSLESTVRVTSVAAWEQHVKGEYLYHNSWMTDLPTNNAVFLGVRKPDGGGVTLALIFRMSFLARFRSLGVLVGTCKKNGRLWNANLPHFLAVSC